MNADDAGCLIIDDNSYVKISTISVKRGMLQLQQTWGNKYK